MNPSSTDTLQNPEANPLATADQAEFERTALRLLPRPEIQQALENARELYRADDFAQTASGRSTLEQACCEMVLCLLNLVIASDTARPRIVWIVNPAHRWFGHSIDGARYGIDSPDRAYRTAILDPAGSYQIRGRRINSGQRAFSFQFYNDQTYGGPSVDTLLNEAASFVDLAKGGKIDTPLDGLLDEDLVIADDGSYVVSIDPEPANGRANHLQLRENGCCLLIRYTWHDWATETPDWLEIRRLDPSRLTPLSDAQLAAKAVDYIKTYVPYWLRFNHFFWLGAPPNAAPVPIGRGGDFGYQAFGSYQLADDEALLMRIHPQGGRYSGFSLYQLWGISLDHIERCGSRNNFQSRPNADGSFTYAIAARDPGIYNWLDTGGLDYGGYMIRWEAMPPGARSVDGLVREVKRVKLAELDSLLASDVPRSTPKQRAAELAERARGFLRRFSESS